ncbi:MAG TPA: ribbon-helix-helix protein, CopG family [Chloroflexota bacterium]|jgi:hypothetical protein
MYLDEEQLRALKHLAAEEHESVALLVRRAVDEFLARRFQNADDWGRRFDELVTRVQGRVPPGLMAEQIEDDITTARAEVRQLHRSSHARGR